MDGPHVNWDALKLLIEERKQKVLNTLLNLGELWFTCCTRSIQNGHEISRLENGAGFQKYEWTVL